MRKSMRKRRRYFRIRNVSREKIDFLLDELLEDSALDASYLIMTIGACIIATLGLLANSAAVIIGAMIVAPLMMPIRGLAFGGLEGDAKLLRQALLSLIVGTAIAITLSWLIGILVRLPEYGGEIFARSQPTLLDLGVAVAAGGISGFAKIDPKISSTAAGTAIAVALMPPLCVVGLGLAQGNWDLSRGATLLYLTNLIGIALSCMLAFLVKGYSPLARAKKALTLAVISTSILIIPLGVGLVDLLRQAYLQATLKRALTGRTITFQAVQLVSVKTDWQKKPPLVNLAVLASNPITPKQVRLLEDFLEQEMQRPFRLVFEIGQIKQVSREKLNSFLTPIAIYAIATGRQEQLLEHWQQLLLSIGSMSGQLQQILPYKIETQPNPEALNKDQPQLPPETSTPFPVNN